MDADITVLHGQPTSRKFVAGHGHPSKVVRVLGWNSPRELRELRQLVVDRTPWPPPRGEGDFPDTQRGEGDFPGTRCPEGPLHRLSGPGDRGADAGVGNAGAGQ
jgi:hypothetical protein